MNIYALSSLAASYACFPLAILVYQNDPKNQLNRIFTLSCILLGCLAFTEFGLRQAADAAIAYIWLKMGAFWPLVISVYLHFVLVFTKSKALQSRMTYFLLYAPAFFFTTLALTTPLVSEEPHKEYWGWMYTTPENPLIYNLTSIWALFMTIVPLFLCFLYFHRTKDPVERGRAKYVVAALLVPVMVISAFKGISPLTGIKVPDLTVTAFAVQLSIITYGIYRYNIFALTPAVAADDIVAAMSNVLFLVRMDGLVLLANQSAQALLGYSEPELTGQPFQIIFAEKDWRKIQKVTVLESGITNQEMSLVAKNGKIIPVLASISVIQDKNENNLGILCVCSDLTDHKQAEEARRKEVLLKEIHHRVKNNMQIISSLLSLQSRYIEDDKYKEMFKESRNRIRSMALIHEKLYQSQNLENINVCEYITDLVEGLVRSYSDQDITLRIEADDIYLGVDSTVPCGLIINELVSNALKHAFPDKKGEIRVGFHENEGVITLKIADNGIGIPDTIDFKNTETLGLRLVTILTEDQLEGEINLTRGKGTEFCITFKNEDKT